jgi:hypothetical protein
MGPHLTVLAVRCEGETLGNGEGISARQSEASSGPTNFFLERVMARSLYGDPLGSTDGEILGSLDC